MINIKIHLQRIKNPGYAGGYGILLSVECHSNLYPVGSKDPSSDVVLLPLENKTLSIRMPLLNLMHDIQLFRERLSEKSAKCTRQSCKVVGWVIINIRFISIENGRCHDLAAKICMRFREMWMKEFLGYSFSSGYSAYVAKNYSALCVKMPSKTH